MPSMVAAKLDEERKSAFATLARSQGLSESDLLRALIAKALDDAAVQAPAPRAVRRGGRQVKLRLWADEARAVERLAQAEARSVPAWIAALVRRAAIGAVPFNSAELDALNRLLVHLGPLSRQLRERAGQEAHRDGLSADEVRALAEAYTRLRAQVVDLIDRASNRYAPEGPGLP